MISLGALTGNTLFSIILSRLGRKVAIYSLAFPHAVSSPARRNIRFCEEIENFFFFVCFISIFSFFGCCCIMLEALIIYMRRAFSLVSLVAVRTLLCLFLLVKYVTHRKRFFIFFFMFNI